MPDREPNDPHIVPPLFGLIVFEFGFSAYATPKQNSTTETATVLSADTLYGSFFLETETITITRLIPAVYSPQIECYAEECVF